MSEPDDDAIAAVGELGTALVDAGYPVTDVGRLLHATAVAHDRPDVAVGVLPGAILVDDGRAGRTRLVPAAGTLLSFEQVAAVGRLAADAAGGCGWPQARSAARAARAIPARYPRWAMLLGSGLMSGGIAVVFRTAWWAVALDALLGLAIGAALLRFGSSRAMAVLPFFAAFAVALVVWLAATALGLEQTPLFAICAPLVTLIPGATVTNAVLEISAGDVVSGGGRLVSGAVVWALLAAGIAAAAGLFGTEVVGVDLIGASGSDARSAVDLGAFGAVPPTAAVWPAILVLAAGVGLFFTATPQTTAVIAGTLLLTYGVTLGAETLVAAPAASGVAAGVALAATRLLERRRPELPSVVVFRPAFWLLVPGSLGLVAATGIAEHPGQDGALLASTAWTVLALVIGVQVGALVAEAAGGAGGAPAQPARTSRA